MEPPISDDDEREPMQVIYDEVAPFTREDYDRILAARVKRQPHQGNRERERRLRQEWRNPPGRD